MLVGRPRLRCLSFAGKGRLRTFVIVTIGLVLFLASTLFFNDLHRDRSPQSLQSSNNEPFQIEEGTVPSYLHLLVHAPNGNSELCKTLLSAAVTGFSTPTLINWGHTLDDTDTSAEDRQKGLIKGVLEYLQNLPPERENDLVLIVNHDIWFQLRPSVLITRYYEMIHQSSMQLTEEFGYKIEEEILFAARNECSPWTEDDVACYAAPDPPLLGDTNGAKADKESNYTLPHHLDSSTIIGPVRRLRDMFNRAHEYIAEGEDSDENSTTQMIFSRIFGEQEYQRAISRQSKLSILKSWWSSSHSFLGSHSSHKPPGINEDRPYQFGIGLDYGGLLSQSTLDSTTTASAWLRYNDTSTPLGVSELNTTSPLSTSPLPELPPLITDSNPPFLLNLTQPPSLSSALENTTWLQTPLYTNLHTTTIPTLLHHSSNTTRSRLLWPYMWYVPYSRLLFTSTIISPVSALAITPANSSIHPRLGEAISWLSPIEEKGGAKSAAGEWVSWNSICKGKEDELFRDEGGVWMRPREDLQREIRKLLGEAAEADLGGWFGGRREEERDDLGIGR